MLPAVCSDPENKGARTRPSWEVADIFRQYGRNYQRHRALSLPQLKVMQAIERCRTAALGGHMERCDACGYEKPSYNSCRNRHCPKCQTLSKARWLQARMEELLPVGYFHDVFTLPHEINPIALCNQKVVLDILFKAVSETLITYGKNPQNGLGGKLGFIAVLHTWDQTLMDHFHLHCVIPGGALASDHSRWIPARENFLFHVKALSRTFRRKFLGLLKKAFDQGRLIFPGKTAELGTQKGFTRLRTKLKAKEWVVYSKKPFAGPEQVLDYIGRYTHRVAISNHRIKNIEQGRVTFTYRDRSKGEALKERTLEAEEFIRRFLLHVLPNGFVRIRHFGFLANRCKKQNLKRCRQFLNVPEKQSETIETTCQELMLKLTGMDITQCPCCKQGKMQVVGEIPRSLEPIYLDSS